MTNEGRAQIQRLVARDEQREREERAEPESQLNRALLFFYANGYSTAKKLAAYFWPGKSREFLQSAMHEIAKLKALGWIGVEVGSGARRILSYYLTDAGAMQATRLVKSRATKASGHVRMRSYRSAAGMIGERVYRVDMADWLYEFVSGLDNWQRYKAYDERGDYAVAFWPGGTVYIDRATRTTYAPPRYYLLKKGASYDDSGSYRLVWQGRLTKAARIRLNASLRASDERGVLFIETFYG